MFLDEYIRMGGKRWGMNKRFPIKCENHRLHGHGALGSDHVCEQSKKGKW